MLHSFPYKDMFQPVEIPDKNIISIFNYHDSGIIEYDDIRDAVLESLDSPIGTPRIEDIAKGKRNAVIISDDYTRQTPVRIIMPILIDKLKSVGVEDITILVALGTHRPMTEEEMLKRFGKKICSEYKIINHDYKDPLCLKDVGYTSNGARVYLNSIAYEADLLIGLGQIAPHRIAGYSGGAKIILPGIAGEECIAKTHWEGGFANTEEILGVVDNPVRASMNEAAQKVGLDFIVNVVCDPAGELVGCFSGDYQKAHIEGAKLAEKVFGAYFHEKADIVIADSYPKDIELWQAAKALYAADLMVKEGGIIILVSPCTEGVSKTHSNILRYGYKSEAETLKDIETGVLEDMAVASHCLRVGRIIKDKSRCIMVKNSIHRDDIKALGFLYSSTPQRALDRALKIKGPNARIAVLSEGGEALPVYMRASRF